MDEQLLIEECKQGKSWAYKKLYELYAPAMMSVCVRYINDRDIARDVLQDGFIKVFKKIDTYSNKGAFGGWMQRVFVTTALEYLRANRNLKQNVDITEVEQTTSTMSFSALDKLSADELLSCITTLPDGYRTVFNLFAIEGYSHSDIAEMLHIKEATSRSQFIRAKKALQKSVSILISGKSERE